MVRSPGRTAMATGWAAAATWSSRTRAARNWALDADGALLEGAPEPDPLVAGGAVVVGAVAAGAACRSSPPEQAASRMPRASRTARLRGGARMAPFSPARADFAGGPRAPGASVGAPG